MSKAFSPRWTRALIATNWAARINAETTPAALAQRSRGAAPSSVRLAACTGAANAADLLDSTTAWVGHGALLAAKCIGIPVSQGALVLTAFPVARLLVGDGTPRNSLQSTGKKTQNWATVKTFGLLGLPEAFLLAAAASSAVAAKPVCQHGLLAIALSLRCLIQVPRAAVAMITVAAALLGAGIALLHRALKQASLAGHGRIDRFTHKLDTFEVGLSFKSQFMTAVQASLRAKLAGLRALITVSDGAEILRVGLGNMMPQPEGAGHV